MSKIYLFIGAPGSGKGTQAKFFSSLDGVTHLSTGDLLRDEVRSKTTLGTSVEDLMKNGKLVPDSLVHSIVAKALNDLKQQKVIILDGYPRTYAQYKLLDEYLTDSQQLIHKSFYFKLDKSAVIERISGRLTCNKTGKIYHKLFNPPPDHILDNLTVRSDDSPEKASVRFDTFIKETQPIIDSLSDSLLTVDASLPISQINKSLNPFFNDSV